MDFKLILSTFTIDRCTEKRTRRKDGCILEEVSGRHANLLSRHLGPNNLVLEPSRLLILHFKYRTVSVQSTICFKKGQKAYQCGLRKSPS